MLNTLKENWYFVVSWIIVMTVFASIQYIYQQKINQHLDNLNVSFSGVVTKDTYLGGSHQNLMLLDILVAAPSHYDVRETEEVYFCVIKDNKAEFILDASNYQLEVGDSISVISKPLRLINYTKSRIDEVKIRNFMTFSKYRELRKKHEL